MIAIETGTSRSLAVIGRDACQAARAARDNGETAQLTVDGVPVAVIAPLPPAQPRQDTACKCCTDNECDCGGRKTGTVTRTGEIVP